MNAHRFHMPPAVDTGRGREGATQKGLDDSMADPRPGNHESNQNSSAHTMRCVKRTVQNRLQGQQPPMRNVSVASVGCNMPWETIRIKWAASKSMCSQSSTDDIIGIHEKRINAPPATMRYKEFISYTTMAEGVWHCTGTPSTPAGRKH